MSARPGAMGRQWYSHGLNTATSLRMILTIIPRVPRPLVPPIAVVTTLICIVVMSRERQAATRNQARITEARGARLALAVWRQFYSFSRFMVSFCHLRKMSQADLRSRLSAAPDEAAPLRSALSQGRGLVILTAHLGNWEVGLRFLSEFGVMVNVVMLADRASAAERWLMHFRESSGIRVLRATDPTAMLSVHAALARNEIVAMQGDRTFGGRSLSADFFGAPHGFPVGPFTLAFVCGAPIVPCFVVQEGWQRWKTVIGTPILPSETADRHAALSLGAARYASQLEAAIRKHPDQWFTFYDPWGQSQA